LKGSWVRVQFSAGAPIIETVARGIRPAPCWARTGTGKELIARAIHNRRRSQGTEFCQNSTAQQSLRVCWKVNCSGMSQEPSRARLRRRLVGSSWQTRSLFPNEIGDIPLELQPKLLRLLQEREFERSGSTRTQRVDVRSGSCDPSRPGRMIVEKQFRSDLLNVSMEQATPSTGASSSGRLGPIRFVSQDQDAA